MQGPGLSPGVFALRSLRVGGRRGMIPQRLSLGPQQPSAFALPAALLLGFALVVQLLAARERKLELGAALVVEIEPERHQRHSLALDRADELVDLAAVQEKLAHALGGMVETAALQIFGDIGVDQPDLAAPRIGIGFRDGRLAAAQRFDLRAGEREPGLEGLADLVVEARLAIVGDHANFAVRFRGHPASCIAAAMPAAIGQARAGAHRPIADPSGDANPPQGGITISTRAAAATSPPPASLLRRAAEWPRSIHRLSP